LRIQHVSNFTAGCGDKVLTFHSVYTTFTTTEVSTVSDLTTVTVSSAESTETETITSTEIITTTVSNVDTATDVVTITVTRAVKKRAAATNLPASVEVYPTARQHQLPVLAKATPTTTPQAQSPRGFHLRDLLRRQDASTVVSTIFVTEQSTTTTSGDTTITNFYTETETSTFVSTIVFTSAVDAKTTVQSTFTLTVDQANTNAASSAASSAANTGKVGSSTGSAQSQQTTGAAATGGGDNGSSGLSTGAKAGIGAGVAGVAVIAGIFFAFMLLARRKRNKNLVASSNLATGAGPNAAYSNTQNYNATGVPSELHGGTASGYAQDVKYAQVAPVGVAPANHNNIHYNQNQNYPQQSELDSTTLATPLSPSYRQPSPGHSELSSTSPTPQYAHPAPGPHVYEMQSQPANAYQAPGGFASELDGQGGRR
jgi:hypothetical protein